MISKSKERERLSSRLGFILVAVGCAVGLGNVWRFPYVVGQNGGAIFVLIYLCFLAVFGLPIIIMEFSVGRASQQSVARSFGVLEPKGSKWHIFGYFAMIANYLLMMFYTVIAGWVLGYFYLMVKGDFNQKTTAEIEDIFASVSGNPIQSIFLLIIVIVLGFIVCGFGLQNGVEKVMKVIMSGLFVVMVILALKSLSLEGGLKGLEFYLKPDFSMLFQRGFGTVISEAMGQAFFTLGLGIGSMAIFGSYLGKDRSLTGEAIYITILDTVVALVAGLIIFPACSSFGVDVTSGPNLVFITLPNIFNKMAGGQIWGSLFFIFMCFAAISSIIAVFENIISFGMDLFKWTRTKSVIINIFLMIILSLPCALGFNVLSFIEPFGKGTSILDLENFILNKNLLPLGALVYITFCTTKYGWGYSNFIEEANLGKGRKFPKSAKTYLVFVLPILVVAVFVQGYLSLI